MLKKGFTLIEMLIVVGIISVLITLGAFVYTSATRTSRDGKRKADLENVRAALEQYRAQNNAYPQTSGVAFTNCPGNGIIQDPLPGTNTYMNPVPNDPFCQLYKYSYIAADSSGNTNCTNNCTNYTLGAQLEGGAGSACTGAPLLASNSCKNGSGAPNYNCNYCVGPYGTK